MNKSKNFITTVTGKFITKLHLSLKLVNDLILADKIKRKKQILAKMTKDIDQKKETINKE